MIVEDNGFFVEHSLQRVVLFYLGQKTVTRLLGIAEQHACVGLEEDWVVDSRVAYTQAPLHHNHLFR